MITARSISLPCRRRCPFTTAISSKSWNVLEVSKRALSALEEKVNVPTPGLSQLHSTEKRQQAVQHHHLEQMTGADLTKITRTRLAGRQANRP